MLSTRTRIAALGSLGQIYARPSPLSARFFSRLSIPDPQSLPKSTQQTIQAHHNDNWVRAFALNPDTLRRFVTHYEDLFSDQTTKLQADDRELIAVVVSGFNGCGLCRSNHTLGLAAALGNDNAARLRAKNIALDWHTAGGLSERQKTLASFAELLASRPREAGKKELEELKQVGFAEDEIVEILEVVGWFSYSNRLVIALGIEPDDRYFQ
ncbi:peroxidase-related enzyme [Ophiostoma piceae UAMH 11346]|uniref:Peroxidase-related enzyme n=1 Tax=Ophiostoma piceae (strain UAMH 11346) TaxID=1262450 RepID=S3BP73_OPHP1|nr:peroxidase-related enzyme [Ophiostoma piceae UAMH 11346]